jgi:hypothetical protein
MVESLKVQIELDGSEEVQSQMYNLGQAGRNAFLSITEAASKLSAVFAVGVGAGIAVATKQLIEFASSAEETEKALTQLQRVSGQSFDNLSKLANVFAQGGTQLVGEDCERGGKSSQAGCRQEASRGYCQGS